MHLRLVVVFVTGMTLSLGCGANGNGEDKSASEDQHQDQVAFVAPGSDTVLRMNIDGTSVEELTLSAKTPKVWPNQLEVLNNVCSGWSARPDAPIEVVSPDGAPLGPLEEKWIPEWSPDGTRIAVACGRDDYGTVVVVSNVEQSGNRTGWSRAGRGELSDRMEIFLVAADGSSLTALTSNQAGDWLPRWDPAGIYLLIESNRDGNSEIYQLAVGSTSFWRITEQEADDQAPVWSQHGTGLAFASNANGEFEVYLAEPGIGEPFTTGQNEPFATGQKGRPVPWRE